MHLNVNVSRLRVVRVKMIPIDNVSRLRVVRVKMIPIENKGELYRIDRVLLFIVLYFRSKGE